MKNSNTILFWLAIALLVYWGVRDSFNVDDLILGFLSKLLVIQKLFGAKGGKVQELGESQESDSERLGSSSSINVDGNLFRYRFQFQKLRYRSEQFSLSLN